MPEGHSIHRLAQAFTRLKSQVSASSPQGRFAEGAKTLDGLELKHAWAWGKHLFLGFSPLKTADSGQETAGNNRGEAEAEQILHVHLGLYGSWKFYVIEDLDLPSHIGAPRYVGEHLGDQVKYLESSASKSNGGTLKERLEKLVPAPGENTRLRLEFARGVADLSGPTRCELISLNELEEILHRLGPDPLYREADSSGNKTGERAVLAVKAKHMRQQFIENMKKSARPIAALVMDQKAVAGPGNIYRAECLFITKINPHLRGKNISSLRLGQLWDCLCEHMQNGKESGRIITFFPDDQVDKSYWRAAQKSKPDRVGEEIEAPPRYYVYQREGQACYRCGQEIKMEVVSGRKNYWCPGCQN